MPIKNSILAILRANKYSQLIILAISILFITKTVLRKLNGLDYPLSGEFFTTPFYSEYVKRYLSVWDTHFGLGFSNILNSPGVSPHEYLGGAYNFHSELFNSILQYFGNSYFLNLYTSSLVFVFAIYFIVNHFNLYKNKILATLISIVIFLIISSSDAFINISTSGGRFLIGQGLMLISFIQIRDLIDKRNEALSFNSIFPILLSLSLLLVSLNQYFLSLLMLIALQGGYLLLFSTNKKYTLNVYLKILTIFIVLIILVFSHILIPTFISSSNKLIMGGVGRNDSPLSQSILGILFFDNDPYSLLSVAQFIVTIIGFIISFRRNITSKWSIVDIGSLLIFLFLAKGSSQPLAEINQWLHSNVPLLKVMGSSYPYIGVVHTLLIYYFIYGFLYTSIQLAKIFTTKPGKLFYLSAIVLFAFFSITRNPAYLSGDMGGRIRSIEYPSDYYLFKSTAENDLKNGRAYYFPDNGAQINADYDYSPNPPHSCCFDLPFSTVFHINIDWSNFNKNSGFYGSAMNFLLGMVENSYELGTLFANGNTRYLVFDRHLKSSSPHFLRMEASRDLVKRSPYFQLLKNVSSNKIEVYENKLWKQNLGPVNSLMLANENLNVFLAPLNHNKYFNKDSIVLSSKITFKDLISLNEFNKINEVFLYNYSKDELLLDFLRPDFEIKPDASLLSSTGKKWYTYNETYQTEITRNYGIKPIGSHPIVSNGSNELAFFKIPKNNDGVAKLFIRTLVSPNTGNLKIKIGNIEKVLNTKTADYYGYHWFYISDINEDQINYAIKISSQDDNFFNLVDSVILVPTKNYDDIRGHVNNLLKRLNLRFESTKAYLNWILHPQKNQNEVSRTIENSALTIKGQHFLYQRNFNIFNNRNFETINIIANKLENKALPLDSKPFVLERARNQYVASNAISPGTYSIIYQIKSSQQLSSFIVETKTSYVTKTSPLYIDASCTGIKWDNIYKLESDNASKFNISSPLDNCKSFFLRFRYNKVNNEGVYISEIKFSGNTSDEIINNYVENNLSSVKYQDTTLKSNSLQNSFLIVFGQTYDPNWICTNSSSPFMINYGNTGFLSKESTCNIKHKLDNIYSILISISIATLIFIVAFTLRGKRNEQ